MSNPSFVPDYTAHSSLSLLKAAKYWAIETGADPQDNLIELAKAALQWVQAENWEKEAYKKESWKLFLKVNCSLCKTTKVEDVRVYVEVEEALTHVGLREEDPTEEMKAVLGKVGVWKNDFLDWVTRNNIKPPQFWFPQEIDKLPLRENNAIQNEIPSNPNADKLSTDSTESPSDNRFSIEQRNAKWQNNLNVLAHKRGPLGRAQTKSELVAKLFDELKTQPGNEKLTYELLLRSTRKPTKYLNN